MNCQRCGACCADVFPGFVGVTPEEAERLSAEQTATFRALRVVPHDDAFRCYALLGEIGVSVACSVYNYRPQVCRAFEVGGPACLAARSARGIQ